MNAKVNSALFSTPRCHQTGGRRDWGSVGLLNKN